MKYDTFYFKIIMLIVRARDNGANEVWRGGWDYKQP